MICHSLVVCHSVKRNYCLLKMDRKFIFCAVVVGFVCLYQPAKASIIRNQLSDFESQVDESLAGAFKKIKMLETAFPDLKYTHTSNEFQVQAITVVSNRIEEFLAEIKGFYINLKEESVKSGVLPDMNKNSFDLKLLELTPKYMELLYTDVVAIILNESRMYEDEKLTIMNEIISIIEIIKSDIIPPLKKEIADHAQDWDRSGLLGTMYSFGPGEAPLSESEMAAEQKFFDIVHPYELSLRTHSQKLDTAIRKFNKRVKQQTENQPPEEDVQNNQV